MVKENIIIVFNEDEEVDNENFHLLQDSDTQDIDKNINVISSDELIKPELEEEEKTEKLEKSVILQDEESEPKTDTRSLYTCRPCGRGFDNHADLVSHKKKTKHKGASYYCIYCGKDNFYRSVIAFHTHLCTHTKEKRFKCSTCGKAFSDSNCLRRHNKSVHSSPACNLYQCKCCGKEVRRYDNLLAHERKCDETLRSNIRKENNKQQCTECKKMVSVSLFAAHFEEHEQGAVCDICKKKFPFAHSITSHKKWVHSDASFTCEVCGITVKCKTTLQRHINEVHLGKVITYTCDNCKKVFHSKTWYRSHLRIHTNDTKYQCKICLKICVTKRKLEQHTRVHTGERQYECTECGKKFGSRENLKLHDRMHNVSFYMNSSLQKHIRQVHDRSDSKVSQTVEVSDSEDCIPDLAEESEIEDRFSLIRNIFKNAD